MYLYDRLQDYCKTDAYPFHMPGHKRNMGAMGDPFRFDITEIDGFDNLHHAEGILLEARKRAAALYGAEETHFLVNGSTCGILSAISACVPEGKILMARNSHKAAYHAVLLNRLECCYLYPEHYRGKDRETEEISGRIEPEKVRDILRQVPGIRAVYLTSPTYEGVVSDAGRIADIAHEAGVPLIVDEAHGAHFGMHPQLPRSAVSQGADVVIQSLHKTLPSLTQTALLHISGKLVNRESLRRYLDIYQTSSPSYVLMASIDQCIRMLEEQKDRLFDPYLKRLHEFYEQMGTLKQLRLIRTDDPSKIVISGRNCGLSGAKISDILRETAHLELEMAAGTYALAMTSIGDNREGFERLAKALLALDHSMETDAGILQSRQYKRDPGSPSVTDGGEPCGRNEICMSIYDAVKASCKAAVLEESEGRVCGEFVYLYPPGIPLLVPGERISGPLLRRLLQLKGEGYSLQGMEDHSAGEIRVVS